MRTRGWSKEQDKKLKHFCNLNVFTPMSIISKEIGKSESNIYNRMRLLGLERPAYNWSDEQKNILIEMYPDRNIKVETIAEKVNKTVSAVRTQATMLKLKREGDNEEIHQFLKEHYNDKDITVEYIAEKFNRPIGTIYRMACELNLTRGDGFLTTTTEQVKNVIQKYSTTNTYVLSAEIGLPDYTIRKIASKYNLKKKVTKKTRATKTRIVTKFTKEEEQFILANHKRMTMQEMASELGIPYTRVKSKVADMGLRKENLKVYKRGNISFKYNTEQEKQEKLNYVIMFRNLINNAKIGDIYR